MSAMHHKKGPVDPVLSSTIDFDEYIKSNLSLSGKGAAMSSARSTKNRSKPVAVLDRGRYSQDQNKRASLDARIPDLSADFMSLNIKKYEQSLNMPPRHSQTARAPYTDYSNYAEPEQLGSPVAPVRLQHSWRAYVERPRERSPFLQRETQRDSSSGGISKETVSQSRDGSNSPKPRSPLRSTTYSNSNSMLSMQSHAFVRPQSAHKQAHPSLSESQSTDSSDLFSVYKVRLVNLKRIFATWAIFSENSKAELLKRYKDVCENGIYWPKRTSFTWWSNLTVALSHAATVSYKKVMVKLWRFFRQARRRRLMLRRAQKHFAWMKTMDAWRIFISLGARRKTRKQAHHQRIKAHNYRNTTLARRMIGMWIQVVQKIKSDRILDAEHNARRDKIATFMRRVQTPVASTTPAGVEKDVALAGDQSTAPPPPPQSSSTAATSRTGKVKKVTGAGTRCNGNSSHFQLQRNSTVLHAATTSRIPVHRTGSDVRGANGGLNTVRGKVETAGMRSAAIKGEEYQKEKQDEPHGMCNTISRERYSTYEISDGEYSDKFELEAGDDDEDDEDPAPPSYDALLHDSADSKQNPVIQEELLKFRSAAAPLPFPPVQQTDHHRQFIVGQQQHDPPEEGIPVMDIDISKLSLEERVQVRRQRALLLKRLAEERVQEKSKLKADSERKKQQQELEEAEMVRKEARAKQLQAKALADRHRADQTEVLKVLLGRAKLFRKSQLLLKFGFAPWLQYMELVRLNYVKADSYRSDRLLQATWSALLGYIIARRTDRFRREHRLTGVAVAHYRRKLLKFVWRTMRLYHKMLAAKSRALTGHFSRFTLVKRSMRAWCVAYERAQRHEVRQFSLVRPKGDLVRKRYYFAHWREFYGKMLEERKLSDRVNRKWAAVQEWMKHK